VCNATSICWSDYTSMGVAFCACRSTKSIADQDICSDSDEFNGNGANPWQQGYVFWSGYVYDDWCTSYNDLEEFWCGPYDNVVWGTLDCTQQWCSETEYCDRCYNGICTLYENVPTTTTTTTIAGATTTFHGVTTTTILHVDDCVDTDAAYSLAHNGNNSIVSGTVYIYGTPTINTTDACINSTWINEKICAGTVPTYTAYPCSAVGKIRCVNDTYNHDIGYCTDTCTDYVDVGGYECSSDYYPADLSICQNNGMWHAIDQYPSVNHACGQQVGYIGACLGNASRVYYNDTPYNYSALCEDDSSGSCLTTVVDGGWRCTGEGLLALCSAGGVWQPQPMQNCFYGNEFYPAYSGLCNATYGADTNTTNSTLARSQLCSHSGLPVTTTISTPTTTLPWTATNNVITRGLFDIGGNIGLPMLVIWIILMMIVGGAVIYYTRGEGHGMLILLFAEVLMIVLGAVMNIITTGIIIILIIASAGIGVLWARKLVIGAG
jgi:hypothetical protein